MNFRRKVVLSFSKFEKKKLFDRIIEFEFISVNFLV